MMESLKEIVARVLGVDKSVINNYSSPEDIESWDSFNALMLVSELEKKFNVTFTMDEVVSVKNFNDIKEALKRHGINKGLDD